MSFVDKGEPVCPGLGETSFARQTSSKAVAVL